MDGVMASPRRWDKTRSLSNIDSSYENDDLQDAYLSELLSYSLERLNKEPELLNADADRIRRQMQEVAVSHYRSFITASDAVQSIRNEISAIDKHLESLVTEIPKLSNGCNDFMENAQSILEKRRINKIMLQNYPTLIELLEIPQLMDTCVRNGNYDEALDLESFVSKLSTMHSKLPIIKSLSEEIRQITQNMLIQLIQKLKTNVQLPECLRIIGYLRRLGVFSEQEMRLQFLHCRESYINELINEIDSNKGVYDHVKRMTDCHRIQLFDVISQYRAIFSDDFASEDDDSALDNGFLYSWAIHRLNSYLEFLAIFLPKINDGSSLASILEYCMYCGMSLGRVGLDFRPLLSSFFEKCVKSLFIQHLEIAITTFEHALDTHRWVPLPSIGSVVRVSNDANDDVAPPYSLMEHPPLAAFVNGLLAALNELRHCSLASLKQILANEYQNALKRACDILIRFHSTRIVKDTETNLFLALCRAFVEVACPYLCLCFSRCFPKSTNLIESKTVVDPIRQLIYANSALTLPSMANGSKEAAATDGETSSTENAKSAPQEESTKSDVSEVKVEVESDGAEFKEET